MEKIILFGASRGGANFIKNNSGKFDIIAVTDNDSSKWEQSIEGVNIIKPDDVLLYDFDKIIIASMFFKGITQQLLDLGITTNQIEYASKNSLKLTQFPFSNPIVLKKAENLIALLSDIFKNERYYFTFGTCLGIVRDSELIPWDDDIDIAIHHQDAEHFLNIIKANVDKIDAIIENKIYLRKYPDGKVTSISIDCYDEDEMLFNINLDCLYEHGEYAKFELDLIPLKYFNEPTPYEFKGNTVKLPSEYEHYLTHVYKDWQVVKKHTSFFNNTTTYVEPTVRVTGELIHASKGL